ncbi:MAG: CapA family protein [Solobacterium sp.]|nr:CapA family protein [Solobacterium sp.]
MNRKAMGGLLAVLCAALVIGIAARAAGVPESKPAATVEPAAAPTPTPEPEPEVYQATLFFAGDGLLHGAVYYDAMQPDGSYDFSSMIELLEPIVSKYDLAYYNQETMLGGTELGLSTYPMFNSPQEFGDNMTDIGFNLVSTATNHSLDVGEEGILRSHEYWKSKTGVVEAGTYISAEEQAEIPVHEINGITYAFVSWTYGTNGLVPPEGKEYLVNVFTGNEEALLDQVRRAKEKADVVIAAMHWGIEYYMGVSDEQAALARQLAEAGADIIIGNHPHVIEPAERIGDSVCFYAMGNLLSAQDGLERLIGMIGGLTITKTVDKGETTIEISDVKADLVYTYYAPGYHSFKVIPFDQLDDAHLPNHEQIYEEYKAVITELDPSIAVGGV